MQLVSLAALLLLSAVAPLVQAGRATMMTVTGLPGPSVDKNFKDAFELMSFEQRGGEGLIASHTFSGEMRDASSRGLMSPYTYQVRLRSDPATVKLWNWLVKAEVRDVKFSFLKYDARGIFQRYMEIDLKYVSVSDINVSSDEQYGQIMTLVLVPSRVSTRNLLTGGSWTYDLETRTSMLQSMIRARLANGTDAEV